MCLYNCEINVIVA